MDNLPPTGSLQSAQPTIVDGYITDGDGRPLPRLSRRRSQYGKKNSAYKFMPSRFVDEFMQIGRLKIGTAEEYRKDDGIEDARSDPEKGMFRYNIGDKIITRGMQEALLREFKIYTEEGIKFGPAASLSKRSPEYLYCMSCKLTDLLVRRMKEDFQADACVRISDVREFSGLITEANPRLQARVWQDQSRLHGFGGPVIYVKSDPDSALPVDRGSFRKDPIFRWQNEFGSFGPAGRRRSRSLPMLPD